MVRQKFFRRMDQDMAKVGDVSWEQQPNGYYNIKEYVGVHCGRLLTITWPDYVLKTVDDCKHTAERVLNSILKEQE